MKKDNDSHRLTNSPAGVRSGNDRCSYWINDPLETVPTFATRENNWGSTDVFEPIDSTDVNWSEIDL